MSRHGPAEAWREGGEPLGPVLRWRVLFESVVLAAALAACGPGAHYGLANASAATREWHADDRARDAIANGAEACEPDRFERGRRGRERDRDRDRAGRPACADRSLLGIPARGGASPR